MQKVESFGLFHESSSVKELSLLVAALVSDRESGSKNQPDNCQRKKFVVKVVSALVIPRQIRRSGDRLGE